MYLKKENFTVYELSLSKALIKKKRNHIDTLFQNGIPGFIGFTIHTKIILCFSISWGTLVISRDWKSHLPRNLPSNYIPKQNKDQYKKKLRASLVAQWLRIRLPMQGTRVRALAREDPNMPRSNKARAPQLLSLCSRAREPQLLKPVCHNYRSPHAQSPCSTREATTMRARTLQLRVAPTRRNQKESPRVETKTQHSQKNKEIN